MPDIMNNVQKNLIDGFRKKYKILILGATDASFRHYKDLKIQFHPLFNACQQVKFQKNLKSRLRKKCWFWAKKWPVYQIFSKKYLL